MKKRLWNKVLSLTLAAEMFLSPLAIARASDPALLRPEIPLGEEAVQEVMTKTPLVEEPDALAPQTDGEGETPVTPDVTIEDADPIVGGLAAPEEDGETPADEPDIPAEDPAGAPEEPGEGGVAFEEITESADPQEEAGEETAAPERVEVSEGDRTASALRPVDSRVAGINAAQLLAANTCYYNVAMSFGVAMDSTNTYPTRYGGYFNYEGGTQRTWGYRVSSAGAKKRGVVYDSELYTAYPNVGRMPDLELDGFYVMGKKPDKWYTDAAYENASLVRKWVYDENWTRAIKFTPSELTPGAVGLTAAMDQDVGEGSKTLAKLAAEQWQTQTSQAQIPNSDSLFGYYQSEEFDHLEGSTPVFNYTDYYYIPVVGRWKSSSKSNVTAMNITATGTGAPKIYTEDPRGKLTAATLDLSAIDADTYAGGNRHEFWIRVGEDQDSLTLQLEAFEPYFDYNMKGTGNIPVSVSAVFNGKEVKKTDGTNVSVVPGWEFNSDDTPRDAMIPVAPVSAGRYTYQNSAEKPARSHWTIADVPLAKVTEATDIENNPFTDITVTVTAPDGMTTSIYIFHVEHLMTPTYQLGFGNTPVGMIERDVNGNWDKNHVLKDEAIANFKVTRRLGSPGIVSPGDYTYYKSQYDIMAWYDLKWEGKGGSRENGYNIDLDATAVVAYQDMAFADPGISFVGSDGQKVLYGSGAVGDYQDCVKRTIQLKVADQLTPALYGAGGGTACWYDPSQPGRLNTVETAQTLQKADGSDVVDLRGLKVLPGIYTMTYTFRDPLNPAAAPMEAKRPLVVLPIPGDVDMDGAVTAADAIALSANQAAWSASTAADVYLLLYRVCGGVDKDKILKGFQPVLADGGMTDYFYPPLDASEVYDRQTWSAVNAMTDSAVTLGKGAKLELKYMGLERGILDAAGHTIPTVGGAAVTDENRNSGQMGPWMVDPEGKVTLRDPSSYGTYQPDTFWMGIYLTADEMAGSEVEDLTVALTYDSEYVQPALVYPYGLSSVTDAETREAKWLAMLRYYNFGDGAKYNASYQTFFGGMSGDDYITSTGSASSRFYAVHYSKVIGDLEQTQNNDRLREMVISLQGATASSTYTPKRVRLKSERCCLFVVPFRLIKHPAKGRLDGEEAKLVELSAGMRDFNLVAEPTSGMPKGVNTAALLSQMLLDGSGGTSTAPTTYAYSAQDSIFGGSTKNLRGAISYNTTDSKIPIGQNKTVTATLPDGTYAEEYRVVVANGTLTGGTLPKGVGYYHDGAQGVIRGTPLEANNENEIFKFTITSAGEEFYYTLHINKRQIHFRPLDCGTHYGETEYRGRSHPKFRFTYDVADLAARDKPAGVTLTGAGEELETILTHGNEGDEDYDGIYTAPTFTARLSSNSTDANSAVDQHTPITNISTSDPSKRREYPITLETPGVDDKYELVFDESVVRHLQIHPRPVWVDHLEENFFSLPEDSPLRDKDSQSIYSDGDRADRTMTITETDSSVKKIFLTFREGAVQNNSYAGRTLTGSARVEGDLLELTFTGDFQRLPIDVEHYPNNSDMYYLTSGSEARPVNNVSNLKLNNENYTLAVTDYVLTPASNLIKGTVRRREITSLVMADFPISMKEGGSVTYGESISLGDLRIKIFRDKLQYGDLPYDFTYEYNSTMAISMDLHYNWVTEEEMIEGLKPANINTIVGSGCHIDENNVLQDGLVDENGKLIRYMPYSETNNILDTSMDGMYLCAIARKYETNDPNAGAERNNFVKCYSRYTPEAGSGDSGDHPLHIIPREVTLTLNNMNRFYGEQSAEPSWTYASDQLARIDLDKLTALTGTSERTGKSDELLALLENDPNFVAPTVQSVKRLPNTAPAAADNLVDVSTDAGDGYSMIMFGAAASNYSFRYARVDGDRVSRTDFGTANLTIYTRPIVVQDVNSMLTGGKTTFGIIYADSRELRLTKQVDGASESPFTASAAVGAANRVTFRSPLYDEATQTVSYYPEGNNQELARQVGLVYDCDHPVLEADLDQLGVTYNVQFIPEEGHAFWSSLSQNYYSVEKLTAEGGQGQRPVEIRDLQLTGEKAGNYRLVYIGDFHAVERAPAGATQTVVAPRPGNSFNAENAAYLPYGTGLVILRPIESLEIESVGRMDYTYGQYFAPGEVNPNTNNSQFKLNVQYETRYENLPAAYPGDPSCNVSSEPVTYAYEDGDITTGVGSDTFTQRGFTIHYIDAPGGPGSVSYADKAAIAGAANEADRHILKSGDPLYPAIHDGMRLFVSGKRGENDPMVYSSVTSPQLRVSLGTITLMARDVHRYYGEVNEDGYTVAENYDFAGVDVQPMSYVLSAGDLASWDREKIGQLLGETVRENSMLPQAKVEKAIALAQASGSAEDSAWLANLGYVAPTFSSDATPASPVNTREGKWGEYEVKITTSNFTNYVVTGQPGTLYVYPRPIQITAIASSQDKPVYTIYNQTSGSRFNTSLSQDVVTVVRGNNAGTAGYPCDLANLQLPAVSLKLSGSPLYGTDKLTYKAVVQYLDGTALEGDAVEDTRLVVVTIDQNGGIGNSGSTGLEKNYTLTGTFEDPKAVGAIKLRTIGSIIIKELPKLEYTYGQTLDLSGLVVRILYHKLGDESSISDREDVTYSDPNQFQSYGLYVNYWDMSRDNIPADLKSVPTAFRKADTGDHLTIAPTHDTQQYIGASGVNPLRRPFAANNMGLIVSAFQEGSNQSAAQPKIISSKPVMMEIEAVNSYEVTADNPYPARISVSPLRLNYTVTATDKTYDGDTRTAGAVRLTNVFDYDNVQIQVVASGSGNTSSRDTITDVVYIPVGASYEKVTTENRANEKYTSFSSGSGYSVNNGSITFRTGTYAYTSTGLMDKNDTVSWASGYRWGEGLLEFNFPNANVHYRDARFASGLPGVGTAELAQYWRASQDFNTVSGQWDSYESVSQMPVEVRNMTFLGPDAANYTWGPSNLPRENAKELTLDSDPASLGASQGNLPYATVRKANRQPIQDLLGSGYLLPRLMVDEHSNVVRLYYDEDITRIEDMMGNAEGGKVRNDTGVDDFHDELHFEYALAYQGENGLLTQWGGKDGNQGYQDTRFFGGEVFLPPIDPGYAPDPDRMPKLENATENTVYKGQRYRWAKEDTGLSAEGYKEDTGFYIDPASYPGYATFGNDVLDLYWYYDLYNTDRTALPRDTVFYPLVRLAETHNYNPSSDLTGDADGDGIPDVAAADIYNTRVAVNTYLQGMTTSSAAALKAAAESQSAAIFANGAGMTQAAKALAQSQVDWDAQQAEGGRWPDEVPGLPAPIPAVKTYLQRLDMVSASWERDKADSNIEYLIRLVEAVEFTDTMEYPDQRLMDAVVYNHPTRYYAYAWDPDMSAQFRFGDKENPIHFDTQMTFAIRQKQPGGGVVDTTWTYYPAASNHTAQIYVKITPSGGSLVRTISIVPSILFARIGDRPIQLGLVTDPALPSNRNYTWTSSDPSVVTVSATGLVTIRGEGRAVITVTTSNGRTDSINVVVSEILPLGPSTATAKFNFFYQGPWADLDSEYAFRPKEEMTRGDVVRLLDLFLNPSESWSATRELAYIDITGKERYYGALTRLTNAKVVQGVPGSAFAGERLATRAEFVTMLARMLELDTPDTLGLAHAFVDSGEDSTWAYSYIDAMARAGVIRGVGGGNFAPSRVLTREEAAVILARLVVSDNGRFDGETLTPSDMTPENWSYPSVLRAINSVAFPR